MKLGKHSQNRLALTEKKVPHYGIRKLTIGAASVLLGTTLYLGLNAHGAAADAQTSAVRTEATTQSAASTQSVDSNAGTPTESIPDLGGDQVVIPHSQPVVANFSDVKRYYSGKNNLVANNYRPQFVDSDGNPYLEELMPDKLRTDLAKEFNSDDFTITRQGDSSNQAVDPIAVGTYTVALKADKVTEIQNLFENDTAKENRPLQLFSNNLSFTYTVEALPATISIDHGGQTSTSTDIDINNYKPVITVQDGDNADQTSNIPLPDTVKLTKDDYQVTAASQAGEYTVALTDQAVKTIEEAIDPNKNRYNGQSNYIWTITPSTLKVKAATKQTMHIIYKDASGKTIKTDEVSGTSGQTVKVTSDVPAGWKIADSSTVKSVPATITFTDKTTPDTVVTIEHALRTVTADKPLKDGDKTLSGVVINGAHEDDLNKKITRTIITTYADGSTSSTVQTANLKRSATVDEVTGAVTYSDLMNGDKKWKKYTVPKIDGYTGKIDSISSTVGVDGIIIETVNVTYTADLHQLVYTLTDVTNPANPIGLKDFKYNGHTGQTVNINISIPENYQLVSGQTLPATFTFTPSSNTLYMYQIKVVHKTRQIDKDDIPNGAKDSNGKAVTADDFTQDVTRKITAYEPTGENSTSTKLVDLSQPAVTTRTAIYDEVTGIVTFNPWKSVEVSAVKVPNFDGYKTTITKQVISKDITYYSGTVDSIPSEFSSSNPYNNNRPIFYTYTVRYTANDSEVTINYVDADEPDSHSGIQQGPDLIPSKTDQTGSYTVSQMNDYLTNNNLDAYYQLDPKQKDISYKVAPDDNTVLTVNLHHKKVTVLPTNPKSADDAFDDGDNYPYGVNKDDLNKTVTRTIHVTDQHGKVTTITQTAKISRSATIDRVKLLYSENGSVTYSDWSTDATNWSEYDVPAISGYTPSQAKVDAVTVDGNTQDTTVNITYTANPQMTWEFVDDDDNDNVVKTVTATGATGTQASNDDLAKLEVPANYVLAAGSSIPTSYTFGATNPTAQIHVKHATEDITNSDTEIDPKTNNTVNNMTHFDRVYHIIARMSSGDTTLATQEVHLSRTATKDLVTNAITYGKWSGTFNNHQINDINDLQQDFAETATVPTVAGYDAGLKDYWFKDSDGANASDYLLYFDQGIMTQIDQTFLFSSDKHQDISNYTVHFSIGDTQNLLYNSSDYTGNNKTFFIGNFAVYVPSQDFYIDYQAKDQKTNIIYQDAKGNKIKTDTVTGKTDQTVDTNSTLPTGWKIADSSTVKSVPATITFKGASTPDILITVDHAHRTVTPDKPVQPGEKTPDGKAEIKGGHQEDLNKTVTRMITFNDPHKGTSMRIQKVKLTRSATVDEVTGEVTYGNWSNDYWDAVDISAVAGYTPSQNTIDKVPVTGNTKDANVVINYLANKGTQTINYVDKDGNVIGKQVVNGHTDDNAKVPPHLPTGWVLTDNSGMPTDVTIKPADTPISVKIEHGSQDIQPTNPVKPGDKTPSGKVIDGGHASDLNQTITRTITIHTPNTNTPKTVKQSAHLTRIGHVDLVTGDVTYDAWSTDATSWSKYDIPAIAGYTPSQATVAAVVVKDGQKDVKVDITYTANAVATGSQTINYVDKNGKVIGRQVIKGNVDQTVKLTPQVPAGWKLAGSIPATVTINSSDEPINVLIEKIETPNKKHKKQNQTKHNHGKHTANTKGKNATNSHARNPRGKQQIKNASGLHSLALKGNKGVSANAQKPAAVQAAKTETQAKTKALPQTGTNLANAAALLGLDLSMISMLTLFGTRKRKDK